MSHSFDFHSSGEITASVILEAYSEECYIVISPGWILEVCLGIFSPDKIRMDPLEDQVHLIFQKLGEICRSLQRVLPLCLVVRQMKEGRLGCVAGAFGASYSLRSRQCKTSTSPFCVFFFFFLFPKYSILHGKVNFDNFEKLGITTEFVPLRKKQKTHKKTLLYHAVEPASRTWVKTVLIELFQSSHLLRKRLTYYLWDHVYLLKIWFWFFY